METQNNQNTNESVEHDPLFLTTAQIDKLTGIKRGRTEGLLKLNKYQLQVAFLRAAGLPFIVNAAGRPVITRAAVEGRHVPQPAAAGWKSNAVQR